MASSASQLYQQHLTFIEVLGKGLLNFVFTQTLPGRDLTVCIKGYSDKELRNREFKKIEIQQLRKNVKPSEYDFHCMLLILMKFGKQKMSHNLMNSLKELKTSSKEPVGKSDVELEDGILGKIEKIARIFHAIIRDMLQRTSDKEERCKLDKIRDGIDQFSSNLVKKYEKDKQEQIRLKAEHNQFREELDVITNGVRRTRDKAANTLDACLNITSKFNDRFALSEEAHKVQSQVQPVAGTSGEATTSRVEDINSQIAQVQHSTDGRIFIQSDAQRTSTLSRTEAQQSSMLSRHEDHMTSVNQEATASTIIHGSGYIETNKNKVVVEKGALAFINMS